MQQGIVFFIGVVLMAGMAMTASIPITPANQVKPRGEIVDRMKKAVQALDAATSEDIWNGFSKGMWGGDWPGRTLEAYSRVSPDLCIASGDPLICADGIFHMCHAIDVTARLGRRCCPGRCTRPSGCIRVVVVQSSSGSRACAVSRS